MPAAVCGETTPGDDLSEIVVTARKVEENVFDVPMSIQVLSAEALADANLSRLYELQFSIPGLVVNNIGLWGAGFSLRGIADQGGTSLSVATHVNGVYLGTANLAIARMFDLERVEVVKGPQGTLYGRNATGGSINYITRPPEDELGGEVEAAYGSYETARVQGFVNLPSDAADFRFSFIASDGEGYIRNTADDRTFGEEDFWGVRASLRADLTDRARVDVVAHHVEDDGAAGELWTPSLDLLPDPADIHLTTVTLADPYLVTENDGISVDVTYDTGFGVLHSITGYARSEVLDRDDCAGLPSLDGCVRGSNPQTDEQWSQEFRLVGGARRVDWQIGANYFDGESLTHFYTFVPPVSPAPLNDSVWTTDQRAAALFGQTTLHVNEHWRITGGLRFSAEDVRVTDVGTGILDNKTLTAAERDGDHLSWRLDVEYAPIDRVLWYAGVSTGFKSGGVTTSILPNGGFDAFDEEELIAYEIGLKLQPTYRLRASGAAFYYDFRDLQVASVIEDRGQTYTDVDNAVRAELYGLDVSAAFEPLSGLRASGGVVWLPKREFLRFKTEMAGVDLSGNELSRAPEWTATAAVDYERSLRDGSLFAARLEYNYRSEFFFTKENEPMFSQEAFGLLNLYLRFEPVERKWSVFAAGRNLADEDYFNQVFIQSSPGYPATWELGLGYRF